MSVDYSADFGLGVEVLIPEYDEEKYSNYDEYLDEILKNSPYVYDYHGNGYTGDITYTIIIIDPFRKGYNIEPIVKEFEEFLHKHNIKYDKVEIVGGLYVS